MNPYTILGVSKDASKDEIKTQYKRLASKHHPDKEGGDTKKFQEIQAAYEQITNPKPQQDPFGGRNTSDGFDPFRAGADDMFSKFFRDNVKRQHYRSEQRNRDLRVQVAVTLESTLEDQTHPVSVQSTKGDRFTVDVTVPRGVENGTTLKYAQQGDNANVRLTRGDLYVIVSILPHKSFYVNGTNLITEAKIDAIDAMLGIEVELSGVDGKKFKLRIPPGSQPNSNFRMKGQGLYMFRKDTRGDLIVTLKVTTPTLTEEQKEILKTVKDN